MKAGLLVAIATPIALGIVAAHPIAAQSAFSDQALEKLATRESWLLRHLSDAIYNDPAMRSEIRRVGFAKGCHAFADSRREVSDKFVPALVPATVAAIRKIIPEQRLIETRIWSLFVGPLRIYANRVDDEIARTAPELLASARNAMQKAFLKRTRQYRIPTLRRTISLCRKPISPQRPA